MDIKSLRNFDDLVKAKKQLDELKKGSKAVASIDPQRAYDICFEYYGMANVLMRQNGLASIEKAYDIYKILGDYERSPELLNKCAELIRERKNKREIALKTVIATLLIALIAMPLFLFPNLANSENVDDSNSSDSNNNNSNGINVPPVIDGDSSDDSGEDKAPNANLILISPVVGTVIKAHSTNVPSFSLTLGEWRIHTGIDIATDKYAEVYAAADGEVTRVYHDPMLGITVEITHSNIYKTRYSNLSADSIAIEVGDIVNTGDLIARVGDTSVVECADETHIHFEVFVANASVDPLAYIRDESQRNDLGVAEDK